MNFTDLVTVWMFHLLQLLTISYHDTWKHLCRIHNIYHNNNKQNYTQVLRQTCKNVPFSFKLISSILISTIWSTIIAQPEYSNRCFNHKLNQTKKSNKNEAPVAWAEPRPWWYESSQAAVKLSSAKSSQSSSARSKVTLRMSDEKPLSVLRSTCETEPWAVASQGGNLLSALSVVETSGGLARQLSDCIFNDLGRVSQTFSSLITSRLFTVY